MTIRHRKFLLLALAAFCNCPLLSYAQVPQPTTQPAAQPTPGPTTKTTLRPATQPATQPTPQTATRPATPPTAHTTLRPAPRPPGGTVQALKQVQGQEQPEVQRQAKGQARGLTQTGGPDLPQGPAPGLVQRPAQKPRPKPNPIGLQAINVKAAKEAATMFGADDYLGAIQVWSRAIQISRDKLPGYLQRAKLKRHIGDQKGAAEDLDLALQLYPESIACLLERAAVRRRLSDYLGALDDLNKAIALQPNQADPYVDRGWLKMTLGDYVGSFSDYHKAVTIDPALKGKVANMAQPQVTTRVDNKATLSTANKIEHNPEKDDSVGANSAFTDQKRVNSQSRLARLNNAAVRQINDGQFEDAVKTLNELISFAPDYANARENLTIAHNNWGLELAKRTPAEAAKQFRQALYIDPSQGASRRNLDAMIREIGKNPKDADDRLALANESLARADNIGAFVEASEAAKIKNTAGVRTALRKALSVLDVKEAREAKDGNLAKDGKEAKDGNLAKDGKEAQDEARYEKLAKDEKVRLEERSPQLETTLLGQLKPMVSTSAFEILPKSAVSLTVSESPSKPINLQPATKSPPIDFDPRSGEMQPQVVIDRAKVMAQAGRVSDAEELLDKLINHIKGRAAVDETAGFAMLDLALDTLADMYLKTGSYVQAQANLSELVMLRESERDRGDPILGTTYRQYAKVLSALNRSSEAKVYEDKADAILEGKEAKQ